MNAKILIMKTDVQRFPSNAADSRNEADKFINSSMDKFKGQIYNLLLNHHRYTDEITGYLL